MELQPMEHFHMEWINVEDSKDSKDNIQDILVFAHTQRLCLYADFI